MLSPEEQLDVGQRLRDGDRGAWAALFENYSVPVWRLTAKLVGPDQASVADIVQEVFLAAARSARGFDTEHGTLWSWLFGIVHRQVSQYWRKAERAGRWRSLAESGKIDVARMFESNDSPSALEEQRELADMVRRVLAEMPADYAAYLTTKYFEDQSLEELADAFGGSIEAAKSKLARARREFRSAFEKLVGSDKAAYLS